MQITPQKNTYSMYNFSEISRVSDDYSPDSPYAGLVQQIEQEFQSSKRILDPKIQTWQRRLKLYNNQKRDIDAVGDPLLFTVMQTVIASLYDDQMQVVFNGRNEGDEDKAGNLNHMALYDAEEMHKNELDYNWIWDTGFFGRSILYMTNFNRDLMLPTPDLQNPMLFYRDERAVSINGDINGRNAARFFGRIIEVTKKQMQDNPEYFDLDMLRVDGSAKSEVAINRQMYQDAQGLNNSIIQESDYRENAMYEPLEWCTHWKGKKVLVVLGNERRKVIRYHEFKEPDGKAARTWPVVDRPMYPTAHNWDGVSIPDIVEDKQRMRAIMLNLGIKHAQADMYPMYLYDKKRIKNQGDLNIGFNKNIPVDGQGAVDGAVRPLIRNPLNAAVHQYIMSNLSESAEKATATPQMQQGSVEQQRRTATELNTVDRNVGTRYSLTAKVLGWSEAEFWRLWYKSYKTFFKVGIDKKSLRLEGAFGARFEDLTRDEIILDVDPNIKVTSKIVNDQKRLQVKQDLAQYLALAAQIPGSNMRYGIKRLGTFISLEKDEIDRLFPPTVDERIAIQENESLSQNKKVKVNASDDHEAHLEMHARAADTPATFAHIQTHIRALEIKKTNPELFQQPGAQPTNPDGSPAAPQGGDQPDAGNPYATAGTPGNFPQTAKFEQQVANGRDLMHQLANMGNGK